MSERNRVVEVLEAMNEGHLAAFLAACVLVLLLTLMYNIRVSMRLDAANDKNRLETCGCKTIVEKYTKGDPHGPQ